MTLQEAPSTFRPSTPHAVYSMSSMFRWGAEDGCTASAEAIAKMANVVTFEDSEESAEGTSAHDEIERVLGPIETGGEPLEVDLDHPAEFGIRLFVDFARKLAAAFPKGIFYIERHVRFTDAIWGRLDLGQWDAESATVTIADYKNGFVGVDAVRNHQLRGYAKAFIQQYNLPAKWIRYAVVQPNDFQPVPRVKQWIEPVADLEVFAARVAKIPDGPKFFRAGSHCRDCPLLGICPPTIDVLVHFAAAMARGPAGDVQPAQIPIFLALKKPIDHFFEGLIRGGTKKVLAGDTVPGMGLFMSVKHRVWEDEEKARAAVIAAKGMAGLKLPTPAQAEEMGIDITGLARAPEGGPVLAFANDKRKPYVPKTAATLFGS